MLTLTYFVHGTTTDNENDLATGWEPGELSPLGIKQAKELGQLANDQKFAAVFCSDLKRAVDSAQLAFGDKYQIISDKRLREINYGGLTLTRAADFKNNLEQYVATPFLNGESYIDVEKRLADFLKEVKQKYPGQHIAVVSHQAPQLALEVLLNNKTWEEAIATDWRKTRSWQPGWKYVVND